MKRPLLIASLTGLALAGAPAAAHAACLNESAPVQAAYVTKGKTVKGADLDAGYQDHLEDVVICVVNDFRAGRGLEPLEIDEALSQAAQAHADDMVARNHFDHVSAGSPTGATPEARAAAAGFEPGLPVGEVLGKLAGFNEGGATPDVTPFAMVRSLMRSEGHCKALFSRGNSIAGVGVTASTNGAPDPFDRKTDARAAIKLSGTEPGDSAGPCPAAPPRAASTDSSAFLGDGSDEEGRPFRVRAKPLKARGKRGRRVQWTIVCPVDTCRGTIRAKPTSANAGQDDLFIAQPFEVDGGRTQLITTIPTADDREFRKKRAFAWAFTTNAFGYADSSAEQTFGAYLTGSPEPASGRFRLTR